MNTNMHADKTVAGRTNDGGGRRRLRGKERNGGWFGHRHQFTYFCVWDWEKIRASDSGKVRTRTFVLIECMMPLASIRVEL